MTLVARHESLRGHMVKKGYCAESTAEVYRVAKCHDTQRLRKATISAEGTGKCYCSSVQSPCSFLNIAHSHLTSACIV